MNFFAFLFSLVCLYALIDAKGEVAQRKEDSPLRVALRRVTAAPVVEQPVVVEPVNVEQPVYTVEQPVYTVEQPVDVLEQPVVTVEQPVDVVEQPVVALKPLRRVTSKVNSRPAFRPQPEVVRQPVVVREEQPVKVQRTFVQRQQPVVVRQQPVVVREEQPVKVQRTFVQRQQPVVVREEQPVKVQRTFVQRQQPVVVREEQPVKVQRTFNVIRATQAPLYVRPVQKVAPVVVEQVRPALVQPTVSVSQEHFEQGDDDTDENSVYNSKSNFVVQEAEPAPLKRVVVETPRKLDAPQQTRRRFNVLLRTADGFNEKAGYSVSSNRNALVN